jgi:L-amino acid N-acyltransferase YncA
VVCGWREHGFRHTVELSLFYHPGNLKRGIGSQLLMKLMEVLRARVQFPDFIPTSRPEDQKERIVLACMNADETTSTGCESLVRHGFEEVDHMKESSRPYCLLSATSENSTNHREVARPASFCKL